MAGKPFSSLSEQVAAALREGIQKGQWKKEMPGRGALAEKLGVNHKTVDAALRQLEKEGLLERQGVGKGRKILEKATGETTQLRVRILAYEKNDLSTDFLMEILQRLQTAGHTASFTKKTMADLGMNTDRITRYVENENADAWIILAGSKELLDWFSRQSAPAFALFGRKTHELAGAFPLKAPSYCKIVSRLVELGHSRIVMLTRPERRKPTPGFLEQYFLDQLHDHGIQTSSYNLPDWEDNPEDFRRCLDSSFNLTPPTALIISEPSLLIAAQQHLALKGILSPRDVSLICSDYNGVLDWCHPSIAHIRWDHGPIIRRVVRWVNQVSRGIDNRTKTTTDAEFVEGGTVGTAPGDLR